MAISFEWNENRDAADMSVRKLETALHRLRQREQVDAFLVIRHDAVAYEWYNTGNGRHVPHWTASLTKSLVGSVSLLLVLADGSVGLDDRVCRYVPEWQAGAPKSLITLRQLATHSSGMADAKPKEDRSAWTGRFWIFPNHYSIANEHAPILFEPGQFSCYSNPGAAMLGYCITAALRRSPQTNLRGLLAARVMRPLGVPDGEWVLDCDDTADPVSHNPEIYGNGMPANVDNLKVYACWGGSSYSPGAIARVGRLMIRGGFGGGEMLIAESWVRKALEPQDTVEPYLPGDQYCSARPGKQLAATGPRSGLGWWLNTGGSLAGIPRDAFAGAGRGLQALFVVPSLDLIAVRLGHHRRATDFWSELNRYFFEPVVEAVH